MKLENYVKYKVHLTPLIKFSGSQWAIVLHSKLGS